MALGSVSEEQDEDAQAPAFEEEAENIFDEFDQDGDGKVDIYEFVQLYSKFSNKFSMGELGETQNTDQVRQRPRLGLRTIECCERIVIIGKGNVRHLVAQRFTREGERWRNAKSDLTRNREGKSKKKLFTRPRASSLLAQGDATSSKIKAVSSTSSSSPTKYGMPSRKRNLDEPLTRKFELFQAAVLNNPRIRMALQKRRFSMVSIFEKGTPGPPPEHGRSLLTGSQRLSSTEASLSHTKSFTVRSAKITPFLPIAEKERAGNSSDLHPFAPKSLGSKPASKKRPSQMLASLRNSTAKISIPNSMSGAVALTWDDVTGRFVRYVTEHLRTEKSKATCTLIFETWHAHLIKARTYAFDVSFTVYC
jgi:hypothetical protein